MGRVRSINGSGWVGSGRVGLGHKILCLGSIGLVGSNVKISNKYTIYTQETDNTQ